MNLSPWITELPSLAPIIAIVVSFATAWFTSRWAVRGAFEKFRSEKLFERRLDAYTKVLESFHMLDVVTARHELSHEASELLRGAPLQSSNDEWRRAMSNIKATRQLASVLFSPESEKVLSDFVTAIHGMRWADDPVEATEGQRKLIDNAVSKLREAARRDLNVTFS